MNRWVTSSLVLAVVVGWTVGQALAEEKHEKAEKKPETISGEVIDMACFTDHGATGAKHQECAKTCISGGLPVGILTAKEVYIVIGDHKPINDKLAPLAAEKVKVTGEVVHRKGVNMIIVKNPDTDIVKE